MTPDISIGQPDHLFSDDVTTEVNRAWSEDREISDACAVTIASWWQAPDSDSRELTRLSTSGVFNPTLLLQEISLCRGLATDDFTFNERALDMLATWAMHRHDAEVE